MSIDSALLSHKIQQEQLVVLMKIELVVQIN